MTRYVAVIDGVPGAYGIVIPDCPGCCGMGDTIQDALDSAAEGLTVWIAAIEARGGAAPAPRTIEDIRAKEEPGPAAYAHVSPVRTRGAGVPVAEDAKVRSLSEMGSLDDFLREEGIAEEVTARAVKRVIALQLQEAMKARKMTRAAMAQQMGTSRAQLARVLDPKEFNVTLDTLTRAARVLGRSLTVGLA